MKIAIMGTGAVGGYFGACLARAGHDVTFIARGAQLAAFQTKGLTIDDPRGSFVIHPCQAVEHPAQVGVVDVVLFCVKLYDTHSAALQCLPMVGPNTLFITLQNGVDAQDQIRAAFVATAEKRLPASVLTGFALISGVITAPGVMRYTSNMAALVFGTDLPEQRTDAALQARVAAFAEACRAAQFGVTVSPDILSAQWGKFVGLSTNAALSCVVRQPAGVTYHAPSTVDLARRAFAEVAAVGWALGRTLPDDIVECALGIHQSFPADMYASMYHDLRQGRRIEVESLSGVIVREGARLGVPTPVHGFCYAVLKPYVNGLATLGAAA